MRTRCSRAALLAASLCVLAWALPALAKGPAAPKPPPTGQIAGVIRDVGGYFVPDAQVTVTWEGARAPVTATSDAKGAFLVKGVPPGVEATVLVKGKSTVPDERKVTMPKDKGVLVEVTLRAGILFAGKIVDKRGNPIAGAKIEPTTGASFGKFGRITIRGLRDESKPLASVLDGSFAIDSLTVGNKYVLHFSHPHFLPLAMPEVQVEPGKVRDDMVVTMEDAAWIVGTVVDASEKPLAKAKVRVSTKDAKVGSTTQTQEEIDKMFEEMDRAESDPSRTTDAKGQFTVGSVPGGELELTVTADGFFDATVKVGGLAPGQEKSDVRIALEPAGGTVEGRVVDAAGKPVAVARIFVHGDAGDTPEVKADAKGQFKVPRVKSRSAVSLSVRAEGYVDVVVDNVALNAENVLVTMQRAAKLHVKVVDEDGEPFDRLWVSTWIGAESPTEGTGRSWNPVSQDKDGLSVALPIGEVRARVSVTGYEPKTLGPWTTALGQTVDGGTVKLERKR